MGAASRPVMVTGAEVTSVLRDTPVWSVNVKGSGTVSAGGPEIWVNALDPLFPPTLSNWEPVTVAVVVAVPPKAGAVSSKSNDVVVPAASFPEYRQVSPAQV